MVTGVTWALPRQASFALIEAVRLPIGGDAKMRTSEGTMRKLLISFVLFFLGSTLLWPQAKLSTHWEELTAADFRSAIQQSQGTCLLPFVAQTQMEKSHDYVVYVLGLVETPPGGPAKKTKIDMHAGESETSKMLISRPDLVHMDRAARESGADMARLKLPENVYIGIWWYARFPNHYSGEGAAGNKELGQVEMNGWIDGIVKAIRAVKADDQSLKIQNEFYEKSKHPLETKP